MSITITSRALHQSVSAAKRAAENGPVVITDRGRPSHVLLSIEQYRRLTVAHGDIVPMLATEAEVAFEPARLESGSLQVPDLG